MTQEIPQLAKTGSIFKRWPLLLPSVIIFVLTMLIYIPPLNAPPHWDDGGYLTENYHVRNLRGLYVFWFKPTNMWQYYPVVFTSYWIEYHLWGYALWAYRIVNVVFHVANAILLLIILRRLKVPAAFVIALIFACHPIHVETLVYIAERKNILSCFFFMLAMLAYWRYADGPTRGRWWAYAGAIISFILAIQSKTVVFVFPFVMALVLFYQRGKLKIRDLWPLVPFVIIAIPQALIVRHIEHTLVGASGPDFEFTIIEKILIAGRCLWFYIGKMLWPYPLIPIYGRWDINAFQTWQYLFPAAYLALFVTLVVLRKKIGHGPWILTAAFFVILGPALGFVVYYPMVYGFVSDHFVYLGSIPAIMGLVLLFRWLAMKFAANLPALPQIATVITLIILCGLTVVQGIIWRSGISIWYYNMMFKPDHPAVMMNLGHAFVEAKEYDTAEPLLLHSLKQPSSFRVVALTNLGLLCTRQGRYEEALDYFSQATQEHPVYALSLWMNVGTHAQMLKQYERAIQAYGMVAGIDPDFSEPYARTGVCWWFLGNRAMAEKSAKMALERDPNDSIAKKLMAVLAETPATHTKPAPSSGKIDH